MGIENENIVVYGFKRDFYTFGCNEDEYSTKEIKYKFPYDYFELKNKRKTYNFRNFPLPVVIQDGMNGDYSIFGICVKCFGQDRWGDDQPMDLCLTKKDFSLLKRELKKEMEKWNMDLETLGKPELIIITHTT